MLLLGDKVHGQRLLEALSDETREGAEGWGVQNMAKPGEREREREKGVGREVEREGESQA